MNTGNPLISIVIPHLPERQLKVLSSIYQQTYKPIEIVIEWDTSKNTPSEPRNRGAARSKGDMIFFCDDDLVLKPDCIESLYNALKANPQASFAYCDYEKYGLLSGIEKSRPWDPEALRKSNYISTMALWRYLPEFDEKLKRYVDWDVYLTMAKKGHIGVYVDRPLFSAFFQDAGISMRGPRDRVKHTNILKRKHDIKERTYSIIIPVHNGRGVTAKCVASVLYNTAEDFEIILIDDRSDPSTAEYLESLKDVADLYVNVEQMHHTYCSNTGIQASNGKYIILLNNDTIVPRLWNRHLRENFDSLPAASAVGPLTNNSASMQSLFIKKYLNGIPYENYNAIQAILTSYGDLFPLVAKITGFCFFTSRERFNEIGLFDWDIPAGGNEAEWIIRGMKQRLFPYIAPSVFVYHFGGASYKKEDRKGIWEAGKNIIIEKHGEQWLSILEKDFYLSMERLFRASRSNAERLFGA